MSVTGDAGDITDVADNAVSYAEKLSVYYTAIKSGKYYELIDITKLGLFAWIGIIGEQTGTDGLGKTRIRNIITPSAASSDTELIILIANMIGG